MGKRIRPETGPCVGCGVDADWNYRAKAYRCFQCGMTAFRESVEKMLDPNSIEYQRSVVGSRTFWAKARDHRTREYKTWRARYDTGRALSRCRSS